MIRTFLMLFILLFAQSAFALTASWQPNTEPDMAGYNVYVCKVKGCAVQKDALQRVGMVQHPTVKWVFPVDLVEGTLAVTAFDVSGNESGLSNQVPFDLAPPKVPAGIQVNK